MLQTHTDRERERERERRGETCLTQLSTVKKTTSLIISNRKTQNNSFIKSCNEDTQEHLLKANYTDNAEL